jgi:hypothetical protein
VAEPQHKPRTPRRGSVSTPIPLGWISLDPLLAETRLSKVALNDLRRRYRYIVPRPLVLPLAAGRGGAAFYPPETVAIIQRLQALRKENVDADDCLWRLWLEGHPVDIRGWAAERLNALANKFEKSYPPSGKTIRTVAVAVADESGGQIRSVERLRDAVDVMASIAAGEPGAGQDLEGIFDVLCKAGGFPSLHGPLRARLVELLVRLAELLSLPRLTETAAKVRDEEVEQAWRDWQIITRIAATAAEADWNAVLPTIEAEIAKVDGVKPAPPSWAARKARRTRALPPPTPVKWALEEFRRPDFRAATFVMLIDARRDPGVSAIITGVLALAELISPQLPKRNPDLDRKPEEA